MLRGVPPSNGLLSLSVLAALSAFAGGGCVQDHDLLGKDPPTTSSSSTGTGGGGAGGGAGGGGEGGGGVVEPPGPPRLTVVNGINDYPAIKICFLAHPDGTGAGIAPWPSGSVGLSFARARVIDPIDSVIPQADGVRPYVMAGNLAAAAGLDCEGVLELAEDPASPIVVAALPAVPTSAFAVERSLLLVPFGCAGGVDHAAPGDTLACGAGYSVDTPTASLAAVPMSRLTDPGRVGLQIVGASAAMPAVDVRVTPGFDGATDWQVAPSLTLGAIAPFPPFQKLGSAELGSVTQIQIKTFVPAQMQMTSTVAMSDVLAHSTVAAADLVDGRGFALVAVGAAPGAPAGPWWHALTYTLVKADP